jgi:hypothetical protein
MLDMHGHRVRLSFEEICTAPVDWWWVSSLIIDFLIHIVDFASPDFHDFHLILGQSTSLVRADVICAAHDFARTQTLDIIVILKHLLDGVSEGNHHCKRKTLRHSHHNNSNTNNDVSEPLLQRGNEEFIRG